MADSASDTALRLVVKAIRCRPRAAELVVEAFHGAAVARTRSISIQLPGTGRQFATWWRHDQHSFVVDEALVLPQVQRKRRRKSTQCVMIRVFEVHHLRRAALIGQIDLPISFGGASVELGPRGSKVHCTLDLVLEQKALSVVSSLSRSFSDDQWLDRLAGCCEWLCRLVEAEPSGSDEPTTAGDAAISAAESTSTTENSHRYAAWDAVLMPRHEEPQQHLDPSCPVYEQNYETAHWSVGEYARFSLRCGPDYMLRELKAPSAEPLYECVSVAAFRSADEIEAIVGNVSPVPPPGPSCTWSSQSSLPRVLSVVTVLPEHKPQAGLCYLASIYQLRPAWHQAVDSLSEPPALRLFRSFVKEAAEAGRCPTGYKHSAGVLKAIVMMEDTEEDSLPDALRPILRKLNTTPALITRSGKVRVADDIEWLELRIDARMLPYAAKSASAQLRDYLPSLTIYLGLTIQGCKDEELPEGLICALRLHNLDLSKLSGSLDCANSAPCAVIE
eukprot:TRINITY_DN103198_c0_g1_i1.p1 TRINITY_DN103198_c0_g1~~TRINITY_DN103198_c0_g1_i1.p1  ORF type:complete len:558 (+),score=80.47 TRINITY_DN103198_c0_g1_i1:171-1676(+)